MTQHILPPCVEHSEPRMSSAISSFISRLSSLRRDRGLARAVRRRVASIGAAGALAASSLLFAQPAAADTTYPVFVTFDNVKFSMVNDGCVSVPFCATDDTLEIYGTVGAYTTAGASSAGGLPYRLFGKWGSDPCEVLWEAANGTTCTKIVAENLGPFDFSKVFLCDGSQYQTCSTNYAKFNNVIRLQVRPAEKFKVTALIQDYDALSSDDVACSSHLWFGPYTAAELQAKKFVTDAQNQML
jgi:hypothetical protein